MPKVQITVTLEQEHLDYVTTMAETMFEGNESMAFRKIISEHKQHFTKASIDLRHVTKNEET